MRLKKLKTYDTKNNGSRKLYKCQECRCVFSETRNTFMAKLRKPISLIVQVFDARTEGMSFNATCRVFKISKNTLWNWEDRLSATKEALLLYSIAQTFVSMVIEGDELYTKVHHNKPVEDCEGWTIMLMERASRFIWEMSCGKKDKELFLKAIKNLALLIEQTQDLTLITDGERRYGNILFEICQETLKTGLPGRPKKTLPKGVKVRLKNKGSQSHKRGPKKKKYEAPQPEHPETTQDIKEKDIHANRLEGQNGATRRKLSPYRRKTNTYAKEESALQRVLNSYWIAHNFVRKHFSTKIVPAVALKIVSKQLSWEEVFAINTS